MPELGDLFYQESLELIKGFDLESGLEGLWVYVWLILEGGIQVSKDIESTDSSLGSW